MPRGIDEAIADYTKALDLDARNAGAHIGLGNALQARGRFHDAIGHYRRAIQIGQGNAVVYNNLGVAILGARGKLEDAAVCFAQALALMCDYGEAHHNLARILRVQGKFDEAAAHGHQAVTQRPERADFHYELGCVLKIQGKLDAGAECYRRALALQPDFAEAHYELGNILGDQGRLDEAVRCYERALALKPDYADAHTNLIVTLRDQGRVGEAMACCERALSFHPDSAVTNFADAYFRLLTGDFNEGWRKYEWRWHTHEVKTHGLAGPLWDGKDLGGKTILLHCEQGLGDNIQCVRYARLVKEKNAAVLLLCPASLARLFHGVAGVDGIFTQGRSLPAYHVHAPLMSLPGIFQTTLETIPGGVPYLQPDPARVKVWKDRLTGCIGFRVGIAWRGRPTHPDDYKRSMTAAQFGEFLKIPGIVAIGLQKDGTAEEIDTLRHAAGAFFDASPWLEDFSDTAALMANLDLTITVDTSVCHLAGALAQPVWTLLPLAPDWRWLLHRADSPWYPSMRLFRQPKVGDWQSVIELVREELAGRLRSS